MTEEHISGKDMAVVLTRPIHWVDFTDEEEDIYEIPEYERFAECVECVEEKGDYELYHYRETPPFGDEMLSLARGIIVKKVTAAGEEVGDHLAELYGALIGRNPFTIKLVSTSFGYTPTFSLTQKAEIESCIKPYPFSAIQYHTAYEGTVLRFYCFEKEPKPVWEMATHFRLRGSNSRWAGLRFSEVFEECLRETYRVTPELQERFTVDETAWIEDDQEKKPSKFAYTDAFLATLNPDCCYTFLAANHPLDRVVCLGTPRLVHLTTEAQTSNLRLTPNLESIGVPQPALASAQSWDEIEKVVSDIDHMEYQGIIMILPTGRRFKILSPTHEKLMELRGNEPSLRFRYLQLRNDPQCEEFKKLYYDATPIFRAAEQHIREVSAHLLRLFIMRYINRKYIHLEAVFHRFLEQTRGWFEEEKKKNPQFRITKNHIFDHMNKLNAPSINQMIYALDRGYFQRVFNTA